MSGVEDLNKKQESKYKISIDNTNLPSGVYSCLYNSTKFLKTSKLLFDNEDYQSAIPIATISIEESMKGLELLRMFSFNEGVTVEDWNNLKNHTHKLTHEMKWAIESLENASDDDIKKAEEAYAKTGNKISDANTNIAIETLQRKSHLYAHLQKLREGCFYSDWDELRKKWIIFDEMSKEKQEALSFFVYVSAQIDIEFLKGAIKNYVNRLRETQQLLEKPPYPYYEEFRPTEKLNIRDPYQTLPNTSRIKFAKGVEVMYQFIELQSFPLLSFNAFREKMNEYLKIVAKREDKKRFPHPMIKVMMMAMSIAQEKNKEGEKIAIQSEDEGQIYGKKFKIRFGVIVKMNTGVCNLVRIVDIDYPKIEFTQDMIEKIIQTETIIEQNEGNEIPNNIYVKALNMIGIKTKIIKSEEIPEAIHFAKKMTKFRQRKETISQIDTISEDTWDGLSVVLKSEIISSYGRVKYPKYKMHILSSDNTKKFECRKMILMILEKRYMSTA